MRDKVTTRPTYDLSTHAKGRIRKSLKKGDKARIAEVTGATPDYVKKVIAQARADKSSLARRIWLAANRITIDRNRLKGELGA